MGLGILWVSPCYPSTFWKEKDEVKGKEKQEEARCISHDELCTEGLRHSSTADLGRWKGLGDPSHDGGIISTSGVMAQGRASSACRRCSESSDNPETAL